MISLDLNLGHLGSLKAKKDLKEKVLSFIEALIVLDLLFLSEF